MGQTPRRTHRMMWSVPVGRILGIGIRLHVTFVLLLVLFASSGTLGWLVLVFGCVLVHELAHSVTARRRGADVEEIVLLPIGGVSRIRNLSDDPRVEAWVAAVGPLASIGLAAGTALVALALRVDLLPADLYGGNVLARLTWFNLLLGGFNLLPAFPMDGGRVLRAVLALRYDPETATRVAAAIGRAIAGALFVAGLYVDAWLLFIAVFVYFGATSEEVASVVHARAHGLHVEDVMLLDPVTVDGHAGIEEVRALLRHSAQPSFPVTEEDRYVGILDAPAVRASGSGHLAEELADRNAPVLDPADALDPTAFEALEDSGRHVLAVVHSGRVVGMLREEDIVQSLLGSSPPGTRRTDRPSG